MNKNIQEIIQSLNQGWPSVYISPCTYDSASADEKLALAEAFRQYEIRKNNFI